ncbi:adenosylcobinamide-phosphate synthase CbiB [Paenibacillus sp. GCM10027626]|uniref:adenosylcobinamide-phosphate synthase CbiB n=1 Tax=Paenibacillus sp. GCM10027626 TaxID=3273411 RepID=UPI0036325CCB
MIFYSLQEILLLTAAAIVIDWLVGDPKWPTHPVIYIGRLIRFVEGLLFPAAEGGSPAMTGKALRSRGVLLTAAVTVCSGTLMWAIVAAAQWIHPWLGYGLSAWFISTTIAVKGLKDAALLVYQPLVAGDLLEARKYVGYIVGRDTAAMDERDVTRATVETVAENIVDAFVSPILYALLGGAPLAMLYRSANTLDSMVGYKNDRYLHFGWASARFDDLLNYIPARLSGLLLVVTGLLYPALSAKRSLLSILKFARLHPSPNSGIPESAVAGALGIELGGRNVYFGRVSERARLGWPLRPLAVRDIISAVMMLYTVSALFFMGVTAGWLLVYW